MLSEDGRYAISFNGEIYNFCELRLELESTGWHFRGHSDTEVLLAAISVWGIERALQRSAGMFAIALWDASRQVLYLARDRIGIKPLYYWVAGRQLVFASELRPIVAWLGKLPDICSGALAKYLRLGYVPGPESIFQGVEKLEPGTWLAFHRGGVSGPNAFWTVATAAEEGLRSPIAGVDNAIAGLEGVLKDCVAEHMVSDVPLGAFLSGGIDSSAVVATMQTLSSRPVRTFSIGFDATGYDEAGHAAAVAKHLRTDHTELYVTERDAQDLIPDLPVAYDEPFADVSQIPTLLVCRLARSAVTVALSGDGGDELFAGYNRYLFVSRFRRKLASIPLPMRRAISAFILALPVRMWDRGFSAVERFLPRSMAIALPGQKMHKVASILGSRSLNDLHWRVVSQWAVPELALSADFRIDREMSLPRVRHPGGVEMGDVYQQMLWDIQTYLVEDILTKVDRASMRYGLEARVPLLDHRLVEYALRIPMAMKLREGEGKWVLRQLLYRHVPRELVDRPKMGFGVPIGEWLKGPLRAWAESYFDLNHLTQEGIFEPFVVRQTWEQHLKGTVDRGGLLWTVLMFQLWRETSRQWV